VELAEADRLASDVFRTRRIADLDLGAGEQAARTDRVHPRIRSNGDLRGSPEGGHRLRIAPGTDQREPQQAVDGDAPGRIPAALQRVGALRAFEHPPHVTTGEGRAVWHRNAFDYQE